MNSNSKMVTFLYTKRVGRCFLKVIMKLHLDRVVIVFLRSPCSRLIINRYIKKNGIEVTKEQKASFRSFRDMFARTKEDLSCDLEPEHLVSPCDGWISSFSIDDESSFSIKNSHYKIKDFLKDEELEKNYLGGTCLIFRLCVSDYHRYCYIDNGYHGENHFIPGVLHSVQPIACETYPVFVLNKRSWCLMETDNFGPVVQCEIGALVVGGIVNHKENSRFSKGSEKGHFDLSGSTIILLFEKDQIELKNEISDKLLHEDEVKVSLGEWIGNAVYEHDSAAKEKTRAN